jgi:SAM-dependent methyltransferase
MAESHLYGLPRYYDMAFSGTVSEDVMDFIEGCFEKHVPFPVRSVLEAGCGTGRLLVGLARRGYLVTGYDLAPKMIAFAQQRIRQAGLAKLATAVRKDMRTARFPKKFDSAVSTLDTLGYLLTDDNIIGHLRNTADALKAGGVYTVGLSCAWDDPDSDEWDCSWTVRKNGGLVRTEWDIQRQDRRRKLSYQICKMWVNDRGRRLHFEERHILRLWRLRDLKRLIRESGRFRLEAIYDVHHELLPRTTRVTGEMGCLTYVLKLL